MFDFGTLLDLARQEMHTTGHAYIRSEHLLLALARLPHDERPRQLIQDGISYEWLAQQVYQQARPTCAVEPIGTLSASARRAVDAAQNHEGELTADGLFDEILQKSSIARKLVAMSAKQ